MNKKYNKSEKEGNDKMNKKLNKKKNIDPKSLKMTWKIKIMMTTVGITQKDLAAKLGTTQPNIANKFSRNDWRESDLMEIADVCGYKFEGFFISKHDEDNII